MKNTTRNTYFVTQQNRTLTTHKPNGRLERRSKMLNRPN